MGANQTKCENKAEEDDAVLVALTPVHAASDPETTGKDQQPQKEHHPTNKLEYTVQALKNRIGTPIYYRGSRHVVGHLYDIRVFPWSVGRGTKIGITVLYRKHVFTTQTALLKQMQADLAFLTESRNGAVQTLPNSATGSLASLFWEVDGHMVSLDYSLPQSVRMGNVVVNQSLLPPVTNSDLRAFGDVVTFHGGALDNPDVPNSTEEPSGQHMYPLRSHMTKVAAKPMASSQAAPARASPPAEQPKSTQASASATKRQHQDIGQSTDNDELQDLVRQRDWAVNRPYKKRICEMDEAGEIVEIRFVY